MAWNEPPPSWLDESCPDWCTRPHRDGDHPEDRFHQSEPVRIPCLLGRRPAPSTSPPVPTELLVLTTRSPGSDRSWIHLVESEGPDGVVLDASAVPALVRALSSAPT